MERKVGSHKKVFDRKRHVGLSLVAKELISWSMEKDGVWRIHFIPAPIYALIHESKSVEPVEALIQVVLRARRIHIR